MTNLSLPKTAVFVSGTDTGIGKTLVSSLLVASLKAHHIPTGYFKPVQTGSDSDTQTVSSLTGINEADFPPPAYHFEMPAAPYLAARKEGKQVQLDQILKNWSELDNRAWVVEGAGGLMVPLNSQQTILDLIHALSFKLLLVSSTRLGTMNHTLLSIHAAKTRGIPVVGIVLVGEDYPDLDSVLTEFSGVPVIAKIPVLNAISTSEIQKQSQIHFPTSTLRRIYGEFI